MEVSEVYDLLLRLAVESEFLVDFVGVRLSKRGSRGRRTVESVSSSVLSLEEEVKGDRTDEAHLEGIDRWEREVSNDGRVEKRGKRVNERQRIRG